MTVSFIASSVVSRSCSFLRRCTDSLDRHQNRSTHRPTSARPSVSSGHTANLACRRRGCGEKDWREVCGMLGARRERCAGDFRIGLEGSDEEERSIRWWQCAEVQEERLRYSLRAEANPLCAVDSDLSSSSSFPCRSTLFHSLLQALLSPFQHMTHTHIHRIVILVLQHTYSFLFRSLKPIAL